jgi:hypothetical protein
VVASGTGAAGGRSSRASSSRPLRNAIFHVIVAATDE